MRFAFGVYLKPPFLQNSHVLTLGAIVRFCHAILHALRRLFPPHDIHIVFFPEAVSSRGVTLW